LTGAKHQAFSTNHLANVDKTKHNCNPEQQKNLNNHERELLTVSANEEETRAQNNGSL